MKNYRTLILAALAVSLAIAGCDKEDDDDDLPPITGTENISIDINGLENIGPDYVYEGWIVVEGIPQSAGRFSVNDAGEFSATTFAVDADALNAASAYILTIEPSPDDDDGPSGVNLLAGDFSGETSILSIDHESAIGNDFTGASGSFILATPTNADNSDENSGVWWLEPGSQPSPSLNLPDLPNGWKYEGWVNLGGNAVSTGKFTSPSGSDESNQYSGTQDAPDFPGEDFLNNAPAGLNFPTNLANQSVMITVEPDLENESITPFFLIPLLGDVPSSAVDQTAYNMGNTAEDTNPTGVVSR